MDITCFSIFFLTVCSYHSLGDAKSPLDYCGEDGSKICMDCDTPVTCSSTSTNGFLPHSGLKCSDIGIPSYGCDNEYVPGSCTSSPRCACSPSDILEGCKLDPNHDSRLILCKTGGRREFVDCGTPENLNLSSCSCVDQEHMKLQQRDSVCQYENQDVCMTCTITGTCVSTENGTLIPVPRKSCSPGQLCDNSVARGECQPREKIQDPHCLAVSSTPGFTDDYLEDQFRNIPSFRQTETEVTCISDEEPICVNCTFVGRCTLEGGVLVPSPIFECAEGDLCDGTSIPGLCQDSEDLPASIPCLTTTETSTNAPTSTALPGGGPTDSPPFYCTGDGSFTCADCTTIGQCSANAVGGLTVTPVASCLGSSVCDNSIAPGLCLDATAITGSICVEPDPSTFCTAANRLVCIDCSTVGLCIDDGTGSFTVQPNAACTTDLFCDNEFSPGACQASIELLGSQCVAEATPAPTESPTTVPETTSPVPSGTCKNVGDLICSDCFTIAVCREDSENVLSPEPNSVCYDSSICDNTIDPGTCVDPTSYPDSLCVSQPAETYCSTSESVCFDCTSVGTCSEDGLTVTQNSICLTGWVCDNIISPGECRPEEDVPQSACMAATTPAPDPTPTSSPASYCGDGITNVCFNCSILGRCEDGMIGGAEVVQIFPCSSFEVCDNEISPGVCIDAESVATTSICTAGDTVISPARIPSEAPKDGPEKLCSRDGESICYNCTAPGKCKYDPRTGMSVVPISLCAGQLICDNSFSKGICLDSRYYPTSECLSRSDPYDRAVFRKNEDNGGYEKVSENDIVIPQLGDSCTSSKSDEGRCGRYLRCSNGRYIHDWCPGSTCFDEKTKECQSTEKTQNGNGDKEGSCPVCGFRKDHESDSCGGFVKCTGVHEKKSCPGQFCFDEGSCSCVPPSFLQNIYGRIYRFFK